MRQRFSKQFPYAILTVDVVGEEDEHLRGYFKNGKSHTVAGEVVFEQYDEEKFH